ncbi:protein SMG9 [Aphidius gifuensis]|uniref:protein SMG9 n=1 Tax=Aphidius gifuensis TaxID=684658 RepID=UPI001CDB48E6|nr:protein SMG9 [Aphidius gifuensis]XP_044018022.1 protein SMG9 [Aphidius gifuensis]
MTTRKIAKDYEPKENNRPTFILKTREGENRAVSPSQKNGGKKDHPENHPQGVVQNKAPEPRPLTMCQEMNNCIKFMDENLQLCDNPVDYLYDQQDFLVVGIVGGQGVGKSTILSLLTSNYAKNIFPVHGLSHHETGTHCTNGVDFYVTKNRVIYLDTQPILSCSVFDATTASFEQKKSPTDFTNSESHNLEIQSLEFTAFLYSVCHIIIFVQDWFVDPNLVRFLQTAEMLKPSSTTNLDQDYVEYYPHMLFLHNKAELSDFMPNTLETMKEFYSKVFATSKLQTHSGLDMSVTSKDGQLNLFLIPFITNKDEPTIHENEKELIEKLRRKIHGITRNPMTPAILTEKNWYHYVSKVLEAIKKSHLSLEYGRLMP